MATRSSRAAPEPRPAVPTPRRKPVRDPDYRTLIMTSIHDIDASRWDALVGTSAVTRSHAYLAAIEAAQIHDYRFFYPVVFNRHNETVAHCIDSGNSTHLHGEEYHADDCFLCVFHFAPATLDFQEINIQAPAVPSFRDSFFYQKPVAQRVNWHFQLRGPPSLTA